MQIDVTHVNICETNLQNTEKRITNKHPIWLIYMTLK